MTVAGLSPQVMYAILTLSEVVANWTGGVFTPGVCQSRNDGAPSVSADPKRLTQRLGVNRPTTYSHHRAARDHSDMTAVMLADVCLCLTALSGISAAEDKGPVSYTTLAQPIWFPA